MLHSKLLLVVSPSPTPRLRLLFRQVESPRPTSDSDSFVVRLPIRCGILVPTLASHAQLSTRMELHARKARDTEGAKDEAQEAAPEADGCPVGRARGRCRPSGWRPFETTRHGGGRRHVVRPHRIRFRGTVARVRGGDCATTAGALTSTNAYVVPQTSADAVASGRPRRTRGSRAMPRATTTMPSWPDLKPIVLRWAPAARCR